MDKLAVKNIGFEVLEDTGTEIVLKRVLKQRTNKSRYNEEMALPKVSVHYFEEDDLKQLQEIASQLSTGIIRKRGEETSFFVKLFTSIKRRIK